MENAVATFHGSLAVGDNQHGNFALQRGERFHKCCFGFIIERTCRFVKDQE